MRLLILLSCLILVGCSSQRILEKNEELLSKVKIECNDKHISKHAIQSIILQKSNSKWLGISKVPLGIYCLADKNDSNSISKFVRKIGEPPVIYNDLLTRKSVNSISQYLNSKGFRHGQVTYDTICKNNKVKLTYKIDCGPRSYVRNITTNVLNDSIAKIIQKEKGKSVLYGGMPFEVNKLYDERNRIINLLQNSGYYRINKEYITFVVDTIPGDLGVNLVMNFSAPVGVDTTIAYSQFKVRNVTLFEDCTPVTVKDTSTYNNIIFHHSENKIQILRRVYASMIGLRPNNLYSSNSVSHTNNSLNDLSAISFCTINTKEVPLKSPYLDYEIYVRKAKPHSVTFDIEGTNTAGDLGAAVAFTYTNRNLFRGSELFRFKIRGAYEAISKLEGYNNQNYIEYSTEASVSLPNLLMPFSKKIRYQYNATSEIGLIFNMQERPEFHRRMVTANFSYKWRRNNDYRIQHKLDLLSLNYVFMPWISETFRNNYLEGDDPRYGILRYSYENLFIMNMGYSFVFNSGKPSDINTLKPSNAWQLKFNIESAGNLLNLTKKILHARHNTNGQYEVFDIAFSQYVKSDIDFVKNISLNERSYMAFHAALGLAIPYGNSQIVPYEKRYFSGGANSVRGWSVRELGPGSYKGVDNKIDFINQTGNIKLDLSVEYRTYLFWKFYGAAFIDAGNIWNIKSYSQPEGKFSFDSFYKQIAVAYGIGLRLNFDYFVLRFDGGMKAINPSYEKGKLHYPIVHPQFNRDFTFHFAVGLPF